MEGGLGVRGQPDRPPPEAARTADAARTPDTPSAADSARMPEARVWRLPPGHPSSPYDGTGDLRPPVPDPRERELPLPAEKERVPLAPAADKPLRPADDRSLPNEEVTGPGSADRQDAPERDSIRSWREAVPGFQELWRKHEEKWPDSRRPPADRSQDEPGSWRGDSGHYLNAEENLVAEHAKQHINDAERKATPALREIMSEVPGATLVGLEFRLKGEDRFKEKIAEELRAKPDRPVSQISENMPDAIRYTYQLEADRYVNGHWDIRRSLADHGYTLDLSRNSWNSSQYKGLNTRWRGPDGQLLEVQLHTPESFEAKQLTHKAYERIRSPYTADQERDELYEFQAAVSASIPVPDGASAIPDYRERH